jgi:hypothetical protein
VAPLGNPLTVSFTDKLYPLRAVSLIVYVVLCPADTDCDDGLAEMEKSDAFVVTETGDDGSDVLPAASNAATV